MWSKAWKPLLTKGNVGKDRKQLAVFGLVGQAPTPEGRNEARLVNKGANGAGGLEVACALATWTGMLLQPGSQGLGMYEVRNECLAGRRDGDC